MNNKALRKVLLANAVFSFICGVVMVIAAAPIAAWMGGHPEWLYFGLGIGLIIFATDLGYVGSREVINPTLAKLIFLADVGWVAGSALLLAFGNQFLSPIGEIAVLAVAVVVGIFSYLEYKYMNDEDIPTNTQAA